MRPDGGGAARLGFGCVGLGSASIRSSVRSQVELVRSAIDRGIVTLDTADAYGDGVSERIVGLATRHCRADVEIATKAGYLFNERSMMHYRPLRAGYPVARQLLRLRDGSLAPASRPAAGSAYSQQDFSASYLRSALDASLRRMQTDYIDVFQLHGPREVIPGIEAEIENMKSGGKVRRFGIGAESVESAIEWLEVDGIDTVQVPFGVLDSEATSPLLSNASDRGIEVWARGVFGGGLLTAASSGRLQRQRHEKSALIDKLDDLAQRSGVGLHQLAVGYVRSFSTIARLVIGIRSSGHLNDNVCMMTEPPLERDVLDELVRLLTQSAVGDA